jgi:hypothetical protein
MMYDDFDVFQKRPAKAKKTQTQDDSESVSESDEAPRKGHTPKAPKVSSPGPLTTSGLLQRATSLRSALERVL